MSESQTIPFVPKCDCMEKLTKINEIPASKGKRARESQFITMAQFYDLAANPPVKGNSWPVIRGVNHTANGGMSVAFWDTVKVAYCPNCGTSQFPDAPPATGDLAPSWARKPVQS